MKKNKLIQRNNFFNHLVLLFILALLSACGGGSGGEDGNGGGDGSGNTTTPIGDMSGTWRVTGLESSATTECDGVSINVIGTIVQSGSNLTATGDDGSSVSGTISGNQISLSGSYPEDGGTTTINSSTSTVTADCNQFTGNDSWSWTDGVFSCSGTSTFTGTRLTGSGCGGVANGDGDTTPTASVVISGTAASGAPVVGIVNVLGANGASASSPIEIDGSYSIDVSLLTAPFILYAEGSVNGKGLTMYSAAIAAGTVNITPITDFILRNALASSAETAFINWTSSIG